MTYGTLRLFFEELLFLLFVLLVSDLNGQVINTNSIVYSLVTYFLNSRLQEIDDTSLEPLPTFTTGRRKKQGQFDVMDLQTLAYPILFLLSERGPTSRAMYQPDCNHQNGDDTFFNLRTYDAGNLKWNPPMMQSFLENDPKEHFTENFPITILPYEVEVVDDISRVPLRQCLRNHQEAVVDKPDGTSANGKGIMKNLQANLLGHTAFSDLCKLFGYKWTPRESYGGDENIQYTGIVRMEDWLDFLCIFDQDLMGWESNLMNWRVGSNFCHFLEKFPTLQFEYDSDLEEQQNINVFSYYIRSICSVRIGIPDGQHRGQILCYTQHGNLDIRGRFPLQEFACNEWNGFPRMDGKSPRLLVSVWVAVPEDNY